MNEEITILTAFSVSPGHYEWLVMSFVLKNAPQMSHRRIEDIFKDLSLRCLVYSDDIFIFLRS